MKRYRERVDMPGVEEATNGNLVLISEVERLEHDNALLLKIRDAVAEHHLHMGPVGKDMSGQRELGGFVYVEGCWCASCTVAAWDNREK